MSRRRRHANASATARIAWRPSRCLAGMLVALGVLGALGVLASDLPQPWSVGLAVAAVLLGAARAWREVTTAPRALHIAATGAAHLDARPLATLEVRWRGPLAFLRAVDETGRTHRLAWWPDTLNAADRRALRLAVHAREMRG